MPSDKMEVDMDDPDPELFVNHANIPAAFFMHPTGATRQKVRRTIAQVRPFIHVVRLGFTRTEHSKNEKKLTIF